MATFTRATSVSVTDTVTAATLHNLIELASFSGISGADFSDVGGVHFCAATSATPNPSLAPFWFDPTHEDPVFRVWASPFSVWLTVGPDRFEIPLLNASGSSALRGSLVASVSGASNFAVATSPSLTAIGFLQADTPAGSYGPVATMGICWALFGSAATLALEGRALIARGTSAGYCTALDIVNSAGSGPMFGMWLESDRSGSSGTGSVKRILAWGPKLTSGF